MSSIALALHVLCAVVWVGGMFFAYMALRPAAGLLDPGIRLPLWHNTFARFFPWVWACIVLLPSTGYLLIRELFGGMAHAPLSVHIMHGLGWIMIGIFLFVFFRPYAGLRKAVGLKDFPSAGRHLTRIRQLILTNLVLGVVITIIAAGGRLA